MSFSDETLMAYADGELDAAARATVEAALAADPQLARRVAQHRALRDRLHAAFEPVLTEPVPARLLEAARTAAGAVPAGATVVALRPRPVPRWSWPQWGAIAASLVLGVLLAPWLGRAPGSAPVVARDGTMFAGGALAGALTAQLASSRSPGSAVEIGVSFRAHGGGYCRTFVLHGASALAGLACHEHGAWRLLALAQGEAAAASPGAYRPAASALPPAVTRTMDNLIEGEPLDAGAEAAARARSWQP